MKILRYVLAGIVAALVIGLMCYEGFVTHELDNTSITKGVLILAGLVLTLLRGPRQAKATKKDYQIAYGHLIGDAFCQEPKLEKQFYKALDDFNKGRYPVALRNLEQLRKHSPRSTEYFAVMVFMALCYDRMGAYEDAIGYYAAALQVREHSTVASNMGTCYLELGKMDEALECFRRSVRADASNPNSYNNIAQLYIKLGEFEKALPYAEDALKINAKLLAALNAMTICHAMLDNEAESEVYFRRAVACGSDGKALRAYIDNLKS